MLAETWRALPAPHERYSVSSSGAVRNSHTGRLLRQNPDSGGYLQVVLYHKGQRTTSRVHRLVATAFLGPSDLDVAHWDNDKRNNYVGNLRWATESENMQDKWRHGTMRLPYGGSPRGQTT